MMVVAYAGYKARLEPGESRLQTWIFSGLTSLKRADALFFSYSGLCGVERDLIRLPSMLSEFKQRSFAGILISGHTDRRTTCFELSKYHRNTDRL